MTKRVVVLMGGWSAEREVSLVSGAECAKALRAAGYDVSEVDVTRDLAGLMAALSPPPDAVFNALHGRFGEDGRIQGVLDILGIPYTHSGLLASALAMDKSMAKRLLAAVGIPFPEGKIVPKDAVLAGDVIPRPYVVKPNAEGSSVGVHIVHRGDNEPPFSSDSWPYGDDVLVEQYIAGRELTVSVMGSSAEDAEALGVTELRPNTGFYDYTAKYTDGETTHIVPAPVPDAVAAESQRLATLAHVTLGCRGVSRADFRYDDESARNGNDLSGLYMLEVNTQPGMTPLSLVPEQASYQGVSFPDLVSRLVEAAQCDS